MASILYHQKNSTNKTNEMTLLYGNEMIEATKKNDMILTNQSFQNDKMIESDVINTQIKKYLQVQDSLF